MPEVSKEKFYQVGPDLKSIIETKSDTPFSLLSMFGGDVAEDKETDMETGWGRFSNKLFFFAISICLHADYFYASATIPILK